MSPGCSRCSRRSPGISGDRRRLRVPDFENCCEEEMMGEWKAQLSLRIRQDLRRDLEAWAERERRKLGNLTEILLEWAFEQLQAAGSSDLLLKAKFKKVKKP